MEFRCNKCNKTCLWEYRKKGVLTEEYLCPECYEQNKAKTMLCLIGTLVVVFTVIGLCLLGYK